LKKKQIVLGISLVAAVFIASYPFSFAAQQYGKLDSDSKHLTTTILIAAVGGSLFTLRNSKKITPKILEIIEMWELLILTIIPSLEIFSLLIKNPVNWPWAMSPFIVSSTLWYIVVLKRHKISEDAKEETRFTLSITYFFAMFIVIGSVATWILLMFLPYTKAGG